MTSFSDCSSSDLGSAVTKSPTSVADMFDLSRGDKKHPPHLQQPHVARSFDLAPVHRALGYISSDDSFSASFNFLSIDSENVSPMEVATKCAKVSPPPKVVRIPLRTSRNSQSHPNQEPPPPPQLTLLGSGAVAKSTPDHRNYLHPQQLLLGKQIPPQQQHCPLTRPYGPRMVEAIRDSSCTSTDSSSSAASFLSHDEIGGDDERYFLRPPTLAAPPPRRRDSDISSFVGSLDYSEDDDLDAMFLENSMSLQDVGQPWIADEEERHDDYGGNDDDDEKSVGSAHRHQCFEFPLVRTLVRLFRPNFPALKQGQRRSRQGRWVEL